jgi:ectoine hydroxylase-related dioxygenase (phytanoyl-CoA dioxygenase family)
MTQAANEPVPARALPKQARSAEDLDALKLTFAEEGYLIFENVVSKERLSDLRAKILEEFERAKRSGGLFAGGGLISGHLNSFPGEESRFVYQTLQEQGIVDVIKALFPNVVRAPNVGCNLNLPNSVPQHYHVDSTFMQPFMVCNIAVVDTDLTNGAIEVLPGTNKKFYKYWRFSVERPYRWSKRLPLKQGDVLVRTSNLWHRGMPNHTPDARPMLALTWEDGGSTLDDPFMAESGKITFRQNWYRTNALGRLRERTFVAAPFTYSAYRFVRSLFGNKGYSV